MTSITTPTIDWEKMNNQVPAIVQNYLTGQILMQGFMNPEALEHTINSGKVTFFSRSKQRLWTKGETSGDFLELVSIGADCDNDSILAQAIPHGPTCHLGNPSCFDDDENQPFLNRLAKLIADRKNADPKSSYTAQLIHGKASRAAQKVGEEGVEVALAGAMNDKDNLCYESADLIYHLLVLLEQQQVPFEKVLTELAQRHK